MPQRREIEDVEDKKEYAYIYIPARFRAFCNLDEQFSNLIQNSTLKKLSRNNYDSIIPTANSSVKSEF